MVSSPNVWELLKLTITCLATTETCEQSVSMLKSIRSDIMYAITDWRMNHLSILKHYPEHFMETKVKDVMSEFIAANNLRVRHFGCAIRD